VSSLRVEEDAPLLVCKAHASTQDVRALSILTVHCKGCCFGLQKVPESYNIKVGACKEENPRGARVGNSWPLVEHKVLEPAVCCIHTVRGRELLEEVMNLQSRFKRNLHGNHVHGHAVGTYKESGRVEMQGPATLVPYGSL
jgi:hypothetical protein